MATVSSDTIPTGNNGVTDLRMRHLEEEVAELKELLKSYASCKDVDKLIHECERIKEAINGQNGINVRLARLSERMTIFQMAQAVFTTAASALAAFLGVRQ